MTSRPIVRPRCFRRLVPVAVAMLNVGALAVAVLPVAAQPSEARGFITVNGGLQAAVADFSDSIALEHALFGPEAGEVATRYRGGGDTLFDVGGGVRLSRQLAVGVSVSRYSHEDEGSVIGRLPHPFFFDRPRQIAATAMGFGRDELATHVQVLWVIPAGQSVDITLFGGPTVFNVTQELVTSVTFDQEYPYNDATFTGVSRQQRSAVTTGFHAGADVAFYFSNWVGVGGMVRFSRGSVDLGAPAGGVVAVDVGSIQTSGGLRLRF